jgi:ABC-type polysaccharide/polyol phosphate export permease
MFILGWSLALLSGFVTAYFPDMQHLTEVGLQILFYATPIIYPADTIKGNLGWLIGCNPLTAFISLLRSPLVNGEFPSPAHYLAAGLSTAIIAGAATFTLVRLQKTIIFQL